MIFFAYTCFLILCPSEKNTCAFEKKLVKTRNKVTSKPARPGTTSGSTKKLIEATNTKVAHMKW